MTTNQLAYLNLLETKRSNEAREAENIRSNQAQEGLKRVDQQINQANLTEQRRSNLARETENTRHNTETERISWAGHEENRRHNQETESLGRAQHDETVRSHKASEAETHRANVAREDETHRSNVVKEAQTWTSIAETSRSNRESEAIQRANTAEAVRSHKASEAFNKEKLYNDVDLAIRELVQNKFIHDEQIDVKMDQLAIDREKLEEAISHNNVDEAVKITNTVFDGIDEVLKIAKVIAPIVTQSQQLSLFK